MSPELVQLQPFLRSEQYAPQARHLAASLLVASADESFSEPLFDLAYTPVNWKLYNDLLNLNRALGGKVVPLAAKTYDAVKNSNDLDKLSEAERRQYLAINKGFALSARTLGQLLKSPRPADLPLSMTEATFRDADWRGADLSGINLSGAKLIWLDIRGAKLTNVKDFSRLDLNGTAWWEAEKVDGPILDYLLTAYPYSPNGVYGPTYQRIQPSDYVREIARLRLSR